MDYVLKLGGSVLTDKKKEGELSQNFSKVIQKISKNPEGVIIHGAGSYGHPPAQRHNLASGSREGILETHRAIKELNRKVVDELRDAGVEAVPVHPMGISKRDQETQINFQPVLKMVEEGFTPVLHGDGIITSQKGFTVLSGDEILAKLEKEVKTGKAGFCTSVKGVLDEGGEPVDEITSMEDFSDQGVDGTDVSGGMKNKIQEILDHEIDARIFGEDKLEEFLDGKKPGTLVRGS